MVDPDDVVLVQHAVERYFVHASVDPRDPADLIAEIVRSADIGDIAGVFPEQIALRVRPVESLAEIFPVLLADVAVERFPVARHDVRNICRFFHTAFYFQRIDHLQVIRIVDGIQVFRR